MITPCGLLRAFKSLNSPQGVLYMYVSEIPGGGDEANAPQDDAENAAGGQMGGVVGVEQLAHALPRAALAIVQPQQRNGQAGAQLNQRVNPVNKEEKCLST